MNIGEYIREIPLFSQIKDDQLEEVKNITSERFYKKSKIIITEGNKGDSIFIIKSGKVKIFKTSLDGREIILDIKAEGSVFGEVVLFNNIDYPATVEAIEDTYVYILKNIDIENLLKDNSNIALEMIKILNKRLTQAQKKLKNIALNDTYVRAAQLILTLSDKYGKKIDGGLVIELSLTREELANLVGTSRETISRALSQFSKENAIEIKGRKIVVTDKEKLKEWLV
ncbi:Crp/Fnr family transcriptional regulator [Sporosalibacterium faouarense]|uniref:Crp/Fnr family transcriptional regulator n=1 Tax=Sporosalibacterium faouarense TaxID=516123 RepID=UPI00141C9142|nr:Crp/Fnr family transcriptional regulator [Sporosalibacterium faouarense]MTI49353.1 Crp/Fnr family transcriptional regulator [Bacillota bacterium]